MANATARKRNWAAFQRSLQPATERTFRSDRCPDDLVAQFKADASVKMMDYWFHKWDACDRDCARVQMEEEFVESKTQDTADGWGWVTETQIAYHYKDPETAKAIADNLHLLRK